MAYFIAICTLLSVLLYVARIPSLRVYVMGGRHALPLTSTYNFSFRLALPSREEAEKCSSLIRYPNLTVRIERAPTGNWIVVGSSSMRPFGPRFNKIVAQFENAAAQIGHADKGVLTEAGVPGAGTGFLLANNSFKPNPLRGSA